MLIECDPLFLTRTSEKIPRLEKMRADAAKAAENEKEERACGNEWRFLFQSSMRVKGDDTKQGGYMNLL